MEENKVENVFRLYKAELISKLGRKALSNDTRSLLHTLLNERGFFSHSISLQHGSRTHTHTLSLSFDRVSHTLTLS